MIATIKKLLKNKEVVFKAIYGLSVAVLLASCVFLHKRNEKLSEGLEMAKNNVEMYQGVIDGKTEQNKLLKLSINDLKSSNDKLLQQLDSALNANKVKTSNVNVAATQTQFVHVNNSKGIKGDLIEILKDTIYTDSIKYNDLTTVYYTIGTDTIDITIDLYNTQYLATYKRKEYKNKKSFIKRLFTLDFKKRLVYEYIIINTNDLIKTSDVRVVELN